MNKKYFNSKFFFLIFILIVSFMLTAVIHDDLIDTTLTIINCFLIIKILHILVKQLLKTIFEICNP
ncbi:hypothetical protein F964_04218 [Acinetobacter guillouiae NIPH 991]|uniref:Uncharacterized protein n=1 Tax=Acinetobacter guillouiae NIPH 991 TaxID=1217656 RepID=N8WTR8_ACIGI|nr:hypothetical protein F964_04218 [Acinetobacter guillouiae NIPH 991]